jgi:hypothetical protein
MTRVARRSVTGGRAVWLRCGRCGIVATEPAVWLRCGRCGGVATERPIGLRRGRRCPARLTEAPPSAIAIRRGRTAPHCRRAAGDPG